MPYDIPSYVYGLEDSKHGCNLLTKNIIEDNSVKYNEVKTIQ